MLDLKLMAIATAMSGSLLGLGAAGAWAHGGLGQDGGLHGLGGHGRELLHRFAEFVVDQKLDALGASAAQKQKVKEVHDRFFAERPARQAERRAFAEALLAELDKPEPDAERLKALFRDHVEARLSRADEAAAALVELHAVFTPEQREKLLGHARERLAHHAH